VLEVIGKDPGPQGIILPEQMPDAIVALRAAVEQEEREFAEAKAAFNAGDSSEPPHGDGVSLRQRTKPFIDMLSFCHQQGDSVVWGV